MYWPVPASWTPHDEAELVAGWRLWLELSDRAWPTAAWDGTPADAVRRLRELLTACDDIETAYRESAAEPSPGFRRLVQGLVVTASTAIGLWWDDFDQLDSERAALLHDDLARFAEQAEQVLRLLAANGGWTGLDEARRRPA
ncbi:hypothetical protein QRX60_06300 [Amycolatopsis mongoliensis]|uniref:Uncharacterized protein n=1 Tax=Amycolatopsis mongoliensis TaxID=715475 RepID=A0A9Y2NJ02_9PSEU|nr:hypothetical protein [Amycolatopsis sp. 4-36]WIY03464.1 hypothetical protein QRX60_06300 [Amycolatopsis sp. 4-36]